jgi:hypothetical protein
VWAAKRLQARSRGNIFGLDKGESKLAFPSSDIDSLLRSFRRQNFEMVVCHGEPAPHDADMDHFMNRRPDEWREQQELSHQQFLLLADAQALTDNAHDPAKTAKNVLEIFGCRH